MSSAASAYRNGNQSITANTLTKVELNAELYDLGDEFDSTTDYDFTVTTAGKYLVCAQATLNVDSDGDVLQMFVYKDAGVVMSAYSNAGGTSKVTLSSSKVLDLDSGEVLTLQVRNSTNNDTVYGSSTYLDTFLTVTGLAL